MIAPSSTLTIHIESSDFKEGQPIPKQFTGEGADKSPALKWSGAPKNAKSLALIVDDPDAPRKDPWVHWVVYNIPAGTKELPQSLPKSEKLDEPKGATQGTNDFKKIGYNGPMPPPGHGVHHYHFKIYALDSDMNLKPGATKSDLLAAMKGHIVGEGELVGIYERK
jgi:Raf kinase inhibitor-like YbhB/YbcL family protein